MSGATEHGCGKTGTPFVRHEGIFQYIHYKNDEGFENFSSSGANPSDISLLWKSLHFSPRTNRQSVVHVTNIANYGDYTKMEFLNFLAKRMKAAYKTRPRVIQCEVRPESADESTLEAYIEFSTPEDAQAAIVLRSCRFKGWDVAIQRC